MKQLLIASTSTIYGSSYLEYLQPTLEVFFKNANTILFIPYARPGGISHDDYTAKAEKAFAKINKNVQGIHKCDNPAHAIKNAEAIFVGGGNTFVLVNTLYQNKLMEVLKSKIENGTPYLGTSAGSNITGVSMQTTNDMPIAYPPSFQTLGCIPFNINAHYLDPDIHSKHKGETRETRIKEFHTYHDVPVIGLREGSWLAVKNEDIILKGELSVRFFQKDKEPTELPPNTNFNNFN